MKAELIILNSKQRKHIRQQLERQFGIFSLPDKIFFCLNSKERVYIADRSVFDVDHSLLRVNAFGLYFGTFMKDGFRLSIEGAQLLRDQFQHHTFSLDDSQRKTWFLGGDVEGIDADLDEGYYLLTYDGLALGVAKKKDSRFMNYLPKSRRLSNIFA